MKCPQSMFRVVELRFGRRQLEAVHTKIYTVFTTVQMNLSALFPINFISKHTNNIPRYTILISSKCDYDGIHCCRHLLTRYRGTPLQHIHGKVGRFRYNL